MCCSSLLDVWVHDIPQQISNSLVAVNMRDMVMQVAKNGMGPIVHSIFFSAVRLSPVSVMGMQLEIVPLPVQGARYLPVCHPAKHHHNHGAKPPHVMSTPIQMALRIKR